MNKIKVFLMFILLVGCLPSFAQQQFTYTQYIDNIAPINPAWTTTRKVSEFNFLARQQWVNVDGAPRTFMANGSFLLEDIGSSVGFSSMTDRVGPESLTEFNLFFAKSVQLENDLYFSTALNGGFRNYNILYSSLQTDDVLLSNADVRDNRFNVGAAIMVYVPGKFYAGVSIPRINLGNAKGSLSDVGYFRNFYFANIGYLANLSDDFRLEAASVLAYTSNVPLQVDVSSKIWIRETLGLGFNYRSNNEQALLTSYRIGQFNMGYSYSFVFGNKRIAGFQNATHEITLGIRLSSTERDPRTWYR
ncbi:PorP/SprF family type IX secretion system membrane protein [uncultured Pedobacter sp.]|uniref:PorP/SprF family type IX secretion system membrane protein n=1 Tax=uncultured Pedobacter sp. TaxID=246139 RepID=UPI0025CC83CF|nr:PorP/SprF family type IX secretion system membrane protein [uncultured Pedobacter sp.]